MLDGDQLNITEYTYDAILLELKRKLREAEKDVTVADVDKLKACMKEAEKYRNYVIEVESLQLIDKEQRVKLQKEIQLLKKEIDELEGLEEIDIGKLRNAIDQSLNMLKTNYYVNDWYYSNCSERLIKLIDTLTATVNTLSKTYSDPTTVQLTYRMVKTISDAKSFLSKLRQLFIGKEDNLSKTYKGKTQLTEQECLEQELKEDNDKPIIQQAPGTKESQVLIQIKKFLRKFEDKPISARTRDELNNDLEVISRFYEIVANLRTQNNVEKMKHRGKNIMPQEELSEKLAMISHCLSSIWDEMLEEYNKHRTK